MTMNLKNGTSLHFDNNGHSYPLQDAVMLMRPQSCLLQHTGIFRATAAIRNDRTGLPTTMLVNYKVPRPGLAVPGLHNMTISMRKGPCVGLYTLFTANWTIPGGHSSWSKIDIISGSAERGHDVIMDDFNDAAGLPGNCSPFQVQGQCEALSVPAAATSSTPTSSTTTTSTLASSPTSLPPHKYPQDTSSEHAEQQSLAVSNVFASFFQYLTNYIANFFFG